MLDGGHNNGKRFEDAVQTEKLAQRGQPSAKRCGVANVHQPEEAPA